MKKISYERRDLQTKRAYLRQCPEKLQKKEFSVNKVEMLCKLKSNEQIPAQTHVNLPPKITYNNFFFCCMLKNAC